MSILPILEIVAAEVVVTKNTVAILVLLPVMQLMGMAESSRGRLHTLAQDHPDINSDAGYRIWS